MAAGDVFQVDISKNVTNHTFRDLFLFGAAASAFFRLDIINNEDDSYT